MGADINHLVLSCLIMVSVSLAPDIDIILEITYGRTEHRGITHTLLFGLIIGVFFSVMLGYSVGSLGWLTGFVAGFGGIASHLLGDILTTGSPKVKPLYPFSNAGLALGFFKASDKKANNTMCLLGIAAFMASYAVLHV